MTSGAQTALDVGIHYGLSAERYHADPAPSPSLSRSLCWTLAQRAAIHGYLDHPRLNPDGDKKKANAVMQFGDLGHALLLGGESRIDVGNYKDFKTDAAKEWRDACWEADRIPALKPTYEKAILMRTCALAHIQEAGFGAEFEKAQNEVTVIAKVDQIAATAKSAGHPGYYVRARFDKLLIDPEGAKDRQHSEIAVAFDLKITGDAAPMTCRKQIGNQGYDLQRKFYLDTLSAAEKRFAGKTRWVFLFIEDEFPFVVTPVELGNMFQAVASKRLQRGFAKWKRGIDTGEWPTFCDGHGTFTIEPPVYLERQELEDEEI